MTMKESIRCTEAMGGVLSVATGIAVASDSHINRDTILLASLVAATVSWQSGMFTAADHKEMSCLANSLGSLGITKIDEFSNALMNQCTLKRPMSCASFQVIFEQSAPKAFLREGRIIAFDIDLYAMWLEILSEAGNGGRVSCYALLSKILKNVPESFSTVCLEFGVSGDAVAANLSSYLSRVTSSEEHNTPTRTPVTPHHAENKHGTKSDQSSAKRWWQVWK